MSGAPFDFDALLAGLVSQAQALVQARAESLRLSRTSPFASWRVPGLLWPNFTKGPR